MPQRNSAGMVKIVPVASAVEAEPIVCDRFASRIVPSAERGGRSRRSSPLRESRPNGQPDAEPEVRVGGAEDDAEHDAGDDRLRSEFRERRFFER